MEPVAGFVVFRETGRVERTAIAGRGQAFEGAPVEASADAVGRQEAAQDLADGNVFALVFRELVAVQAVGELADGRWERQYRDLHHGVLTREEVDQTEGI